MIIRAIGFLLLAVLLSGFSAFKGGGAIAAGTPNPISSISFSYEEQSRLSGSPIFPDGKTDYSWGEVQSVGGKVRLYRYTVDQPAPDDLRLYETTEYEAFALDDGTLLYCQHTIEVRAANPVSSLKDAKALYARREAGNHSLQTLRCFRTVDSGLNYVLRGMSFLGMTQDGPISALTTALPEQSEGRSVFIYRSGDGAEHRYEYDPIMRFYTRYSITGNPVSTTQSRYRIEGSASDNKLSSGEIVFRDTVTHENPKSKPLVVTRKQRVFDVRFDDIAPLAMKLIPNEGDRINSLDTPQIRYEWRDGRIAKRVDELLDAGAEYGVYSGYRHWVVGVNILIVLVLLVLVYLRKKRGGLAVIAAIILFSAVDNAHAASSYCGIYSVAWAGQSLGVSVDIEALITPDYISSHQGSTGQDLIKAAESIGLKATLLSGLGIDSLYAAKSPLILHAAPMGTHAVYQHWVLFLGIDENGFARVVDGKGGVATCSKEEILARWDGIAIAVRKPEMPSTRYLSAELSGLLGYIAISGVFSLIVMRVPSKDKHSVSGKIRSKIIVLVLLLTVSMGIGYTTRGEGFDGTVAGIDCALGLKQPLTIPKDEVVKRMAQGATLIDCRYTQDYDHGTIDGAISLPVDVGLGEFKRKLTIVDRDADVIVFCQSQDCGFCGYAATMLEGAGFKNVVVYKGGYKEWHSNDDEE